MYIYQKMFSMWNGTNLFEETKISLGLNNILFLGSWHPAEHL